MGPGRPAEIWTSSAFKLPVMADSKQELISFVSAPEDLPCLDKECSNMRKIYPHHIEGRWRWTRQKWCLRCVQLRGRHKLELVDLIALWEAQDRRCYRYPDCPKVLTDPRFSRDGGGRSPDGTWMSRIDHDHKICPRKKHSCELCRRGLVCQGCNTWELAILDASRSPVRDRMG